MSQLIKQCYWIHLPELEFTARRPILSYPNMYVQGPLLFSVQSVVLLISFPITYVQDSLLKPAFIAHRSVVITFVQAETLRSDNSRDNDQQLTSDPCRMYGKENPCNILHGDHLFHNSCTVYFDLSHCILSAGDHILGDSNIFGFSSHTA